MDIDKSLIHTRTHAHTTFGVASNVYCLKTVYIVSYPMVQIIHLFVRVCKRKRKIKGKRTAARVTVSVAVEAATTINYYDDLVNEIFGTYKYLNTTSLSICTLYKHNRRSTHIFIPFSISPIRFSYRSETRNAIHSFSVLSMSLRQSAISATTQHIIHFFSLVSIRCTCTARH